jgi:alanyl-tRNA synthetase
MQTTNDIRTAFLDYFAANGHEIVSSSPLVPRNDRHCCSQMPA